MLLVLAGSILTFTMVQEATVVEPFEKGQIVIEQDVDSSPIELRSDVRVEPLVEQKFRNIVRQAYDYSCGSAALTTVLNFYLGRTLSERQVMEGLLHYGESERIVERRAFSMLDMKRLVTALGYPSGGFRATIDDLKDLDHPAIVPIHHAGFKHFVVLRTIRDGAPTWQTRRSAISPLPRPVRGEMGRQRALHRLPGSDKPLDNLELKEEDLRFVDDQTMTLLALERIPAFHESTQRRIQNLLERQKNNPDGSVENTRKQLHYRRN